MKFRNLPAAACLMISTANATFAVTFSVGGNDYDVTTFSGSFDENRALLTSQIWYGNRALALDFASAVQDAFGFPHFDDVAGALFATDEMGPFFPLTVAYWEKANAFSGISVQSAQITSTLRDRSFLYAIAAPVNAVPIPAGGVLLLSGLAGFAAFGRRKKHAA